MCVGVRGCNKVLSLSKISNKNVQVKVELTKNSEK